MDGGVVGGSARGLGIFEVGGAKSGRGFTFRASQGFG